MATLQMQAERAKAALLAEAARITEIALRTMLALRILEVQTNGIAGAKYSTNQYSTSWLKGRELNGGGRAYIKNNKRGNWKGFRAAQGLPSSSVNVTYTGATIRSITAAQAGAAGTVFSAKLVSSNSESAKLIGYLMERYPAFLQFTTAEVAAGLMADGVAVPPPWAALAQWVAEFEPEDGDDLHGHMAGEAAGRLAFAEAQQARAETLLNLPKLHPAYVAALFELADGDAEQATASALADRRYHVVYGDIEDWHEMDGNALPEDARGWFGGGAPAA